MNKHMTQPKYYEQLVFNPNNHVYYNPQLNADNILTNKSVKSNQEKAHHNQFDDISSTFLHLEDQLYAKYHHYVTGFLYVNDELKLKQFDDIFHTSVYSDHPDVKYQSVLTALPDKGLQLNYQYLIQLVTSFQSVQHSNGLGDYFAPLLKHDYRGQSDHLISYQLFFDGPDSNNTVIFTTPSYMNSHRRYFDVPADKFQIIGTTSTKLETVSHPLIDKVVDFIGDYQTYVNHDANKYTGDINGGTTAEKWDILNTELEYSNDNNVTTVYPTLINLWLYQDLEHEWRVSPHTWLSDYLPAAFYQLPKSQQDAIYTEIYRLFHSASTVNDYNNNSIDKHGTEIDSDNEDKNHPQIVIEDHLSKYEDLTKVGLKNPLPILNDNEFVNQLAAIDDHQLYYDKYNESETMTKAQPVHKYELPLSNSIYRHAVISAERMHTSIAISHQPVFYDDGTLYHITNAPVPVLIFVPIKDNCKAHFEQLVAQQSQSMVMTHFKYTSGHEYYIATQVTESPLENYCVIPMRSLSDTNSPDLTMPNNQLNLRTISPFNWDYHQDIQVTRIHAAIYNPDLTNTYEEFIFMGFTPIINRDSDRSRIKDRKKALTNDDNFQQYIMNL